MNKRLNTVFFILGATVINLLLMLIFISLGLFLVSRFLTDNTSAEVGQVILLVVFIGALVLAFFVYNKLTKFIINKYNLEQYMAPLFKSGKNKNKPN